MTDRVYPSSKPATNGAAPAPNGTFPATKSQLYGATRPAYRPQPHHRRRHGRSCWCSCCLWLTLTFLFLILLVAIAGAIFYVVYRPHRPSFSVTSLKVSYLNVTSSSTLNSRFDLSIGAKNPNKKLVYTYDPIAISILSNDIDIGEGTVPSFVHGKKNTTLLKSAITSSGRQLDSDSASTLKTDVKSKNSLSLKIELDTKVKAKMGGFNSPKIGIRVACDGIKATVPTGKTAVTGSTSNSKCEVDIRIKIWKWTF
ncbi:NDR1/HIN1-like protein 6 [Juglans microcarpa x Juglans regia]|uniref:NDR1/HIN1-like protein 6 n=1 Tax=Juglans microcarpa x Juglans regia TaxID=2249226 RepID=UPI001B7E6A5C|nr:NDR1/HIN1-like protein 6 [Juglans microcarpa x Juglans regia]